MPCCTATRAFWRRLVRGARFILADEFQDANFAQIKILARLAGTDGNIFAVGDPDQSIYRFRGASSEAFELFHRSFPAAKLVVLEKNRRSTTPILRTAFALINENPPVFAKHADGVLAYRRTPLHSARDEEAEQSGAAVARPPVSAVILASRDSEGPDLVSYLRDAAEKVEVQVVGFRHSLPLSLPAGRSRPGTGRGRHPVRHREHGRLGHSRGPRSVRLPQRRRFRRRRRQPVSRGRPAVFPRESGATAAGDARHRAGQSRRARWSRSLPRSIALHGGTEVVAAVQRAREEIRRRDAKARAALDIIVKEFALDAASPILQAAL